MAFWISKFIHTTWHHQSKWHITHSKIYFVCMGVFCLLYMMTKRYHKSYTCMCACMWSFVCLCVQLARSETKVKGLLRRSPLYLWDCLPVNPELTNLVTVWLEATSMLPHPAGTLHGAEIGLQALMNPPYPPRHPPAQVTYFWKDILCSYHQKP